MKLTCQFRRFVARTFRPVGFGAPNPGVHPIPRLKFWEFISDKLISDKPPDDTPPIFPPPIWTCPDGARLLQRGSLAAARPVCNLVGDEDDIGCVQVESC